MNRSKPLGVAMAALAVMACGCGDNTDDGSPDHHPIDLAALLAKAGATSNPDILLVGLSEREFSCSDDVWSLRVFYGPTRPPPLDGMVFVVWDMPAHTMKGWAFAREKDDPFHWSIHLPAAEAGLGCNERYTTSFFYMATFGGNKVSRAIGLERGKRKAFNYQIAFDNKELTRLDIGGTLYNDVAGLPPPDTGTLFLQNLFTGATFSDDYAATAYPGTNAYGTFTGDKVPEGLDYPMLGLGSRPQDVVIGLVFKRKGVELTNMVIDMDEQRLP